MKEKVLHIQMVNPETMSKMTKSLVEFKRYAENKELDVGFNLNHEDAYPFNTISSVNIRGREMVFDDCDWLIEISKLATNISVTPYLDGTFDYCLTFCNSLITIYKEGLN